MSLATSASLTAVCVTGLLDQNTLTPYTVNRCPSGQWTGRSLAPAVDLNLTAPDFFFDEPVFALLICLFCYCMIFMWCVSRKKLKWARDWQ